jgi:hypothetical protein
MFELETDKTQEQFAAASTQIKDPFALDALSGLAGKVPPTAAWVAESNAMSKTQWHQQLRTEAESQVNGLGAVLIQLNTHAENVCLSHNNEHQAVQKVIGEKYLSPETADASESLKKSAKGTIPADQKTISETVAANSAHVEEIKRRAVLLLLGQSLDTAAKEQARLENLRMTLYS